MLPFMCSEDQANFIMKSSVSSSIILMNMIDSLKTNKETKEPISTFKLL